MILILSLLSLVTIVTTQSQDPSLYVRIGSVFESICLGQTERSGLPSRQFTSGEMGEKGEPGLKGSKGDPGEADYDRVEEMISKKMEESIWIILNRMVDFVVNVSVFAVFVVQARKLANLSDMLSITNEEIARLKNATRAAGQRVVNGTGEIELSYQI